MREDLQRRGQFKSKELGEGSQHTSELFGPLSNTEFTLVQYPIWTLRVSSCSSELRKRLSLTSRKVSPGERNVGTESEDQHTRMEQGNGMVLDKCVAEKMQLLD